MQRKKHGENQAKIIVAMEIKVKVKFMISFAEMYLVIKDKTSRIVRVKTDA